MSNEETRNTTDKLAEAGLDFRTFVQSLKDYALCVVDPQGHTISWNEGAQRLKGYTAEEIVGKHISIFFTPEEIRENKPQHLLEIAASTGRVEDEGWRVRKDGIRLWRNF